jgi:hypothetical protein
VLSYGAGRLNLRYAADKGQTRAKKVCVAESHILLESGNAVQAGRTLNATS